MTGIYCKIIFILLKKKTKKHLFLAVVCSGHLWYIIHLMLFVYTYILSGKDVPLILIVHFDGIYIF